MKKLISLALVLVLALSIAVPALAHVMDPNNPGSYGPAPMQYNTPAPVITCPMCMAPSMVLMGTFRAVIPPAQFNAPCPFTPGCIIHTHQYRVDYQCTGCMLIFSVDLQYDWHNICQGMNGWIINIIYPGKMP